MTSATSPQLPLARSAPTAADPISARAMAQVAAMPPHERLLLLAGCSLRELARRLGVVHTRLSAVFADATAFGRLSPEWSERLAAAVGATPEEVDELFGVRRTMPAGDSPKPAASRRSA